MVKLSLLEGIDDLLLSFKVRANDSGEYEVECLEGRYEGGYLARCVVRAKMVGR